MCAIASMLYITRVCTTWSRVFSFIIKKTLLSKATLFRLQNFANCQNLAASTEYRSSQASNILHWLFPSCRKPQKSELSLEKQNALLTKMLFLEESYIRKNPLKKLLSKAVNNFAAKSFMKKLTSVLAVPDSSIGDDLVNM